ncbi:hypothetical protein A2763_04435 [Candidatus Kaiserbacteria bacterium RIFCSPHIGHO2_01_FULL_54_36]|uniref:VTT domain-containing protein n=1 Tax=Candidatus Kaiserbacteria bacterium RIFCSPHIGHO2_01_FULL_54_36 TaxID=1798482 RepID=A0A1F6CNY0_9BACT|nr:MAG: hypothetical protein A2763_04435 [Candidatus Kaiserbacteria bacterium RIFCSPHIGHO2_01_FULL_54_36]OGG75872.1 MAG: hypothetical protein A3A41_01470 [Candidatus Kaiserbacteria bacterium RIFCSPLOWO2_01_FULL_54_22]
MPHLDLFSIVQLIGYPGIFAVVFLESGVFFGFFLPGASMLFTAGLLASQGVFNVWILVPLVTIAAILGDNVGYWFGAKVGYKLFERPDSRFFKQEHLVQAKIFYERHGFLAIVLARFVPIVRTFTPIIAGIVRMNYKAFVLYNITGGLLWGAGVTFLGYYLGNKIPGIDAYISPIVVAIIFLTTIPLFREYFRQRKTTSVSAEQ